MNVLRILMYYCEFIKQEHFELSSFGSSNWMRCDSVTMTIQARQLV